MKTKGLLKKTLIALGVVGIQFCMSNMALATPSSQIWIPNTDIQKFGTVHLNFDTYFRLMNEPADDKGNSIRKPPIFIVGPTVGILPFDKIQAEVGFDLMFQGDSVLDNSPLYFHGKVGTPENSIFDWSPAIAVGIYNVGIKPDLTMQNIAYGIVAKTLPYVGRLSAGYYYGNPGVLKDETGTAANHGLLLSWDRTLTEISDKLWADVDYQGGNSSMGVLNFGFAYSFAPNTSVLFGYDYNLNKNVAGQDTATIQIDINI